MQEWPIPIKGVNQSMPHDKAAPSTSSYMSNVRPFDVLEGRIRIGQRPGMDKLFAQQIGGASKPIVWVGYVSLVED